MKILCLNCRGCGQPVAVQELRLLVEQHSPEIVFLSETKMSADKAEMLRFLLGFENAIGVGSDGLRGGLLLLWRKGIILQQKTKSNSHIDVMVCSDNLRTEVWRFTGFYGQPQHSRRKKSWDLLKFLRNESVLPWICAGDFNEVLSEEEHFGNNERGEWRMAGFREAVHYCGFLDLGYRGLPYTWDNRQEGDRNVKVRLDRALADDKFLQKFGNTKVIHLQTIKSDHCALVIDLERQHTEERKKAERLFRYENMWCRDPSYEELVKKSWTCRGVGLKSVMESLSTMKERFQKWSYESFGSVRGRLKHLRGMLEDVRERNWTTGPTNEEKILVDLISELITREEIMFCQRSRIQWLKEGDRNTAFFHSRCKERARQNRIFSLQRADGKVCFKHDELEDIANDFFINLFNAQNNLQREEVLKYVPTKGTEDMNDFLCKPFSPKEVEEALFMMKPHKSPGPDGFTAGFYQKYWDLVKDNICDVVLNFLQCGEMPKELNKTILVLIPKTSRNAAQRIQEILEVYNKGLGQMVNKEKSAIFFSPNNSEEVKEDMKQILQIGTEALEEKYLGLPTALGRSTTGAFEKLTTRMNNLAGGWSEKMLSSAGREILIKAVMQAIPTYSMSCFSLSKTTCKRLTTSMAKYWWGCDGDKRKMHWKRWEKLAQSKSTGGMGFREMHLFNLAMLDKQGWRLLINPKSLWARVLAGKYYHNTDFMKAKRKRNRSHVWQAILKGRSALHLGLIKRIGDGKPTNVWEDRWVPTIPGGKPLYIREEASATYVADLLNTEQNNWDADKVNNNMLPIDANEVFKIPLGKLDQDLWAWSAEKHGLYTVKSAYRLLANHLKFDDYHRRSVAGCSNAENNKIWSKLWNIAVPPKVRNFWWRVIKGFVPVRAVLHKRNIEQQSFCVECGATEETIFHALVECSYAKNFCNLFKEIYKINLPKLHNLTWAQDILDSTICNPEKASYILCGMWSVWNARNGRLHGKTSVKVSQACRWAYDTTEDLIQSARANQPSRKIKTRSNWQRPQEGYYKVNVDASFNSEEKKGSSGVLIRDWKGEIIAASSNWYEYLPDVLTAEAYACRDGVKLMNMLNLQQVILETDSKEFT